MPEVLTYTITETLMPIIDQLTLTGTIAAILSAIFILILARQPPP